jgi:RHS repeat-associated protein
MTSVEGGVTKTYGYDANGNNTTVSSPSLNVSMTYDALNRQTNWTDGTNTESTSYRGAEWHRTNIITNGTSTDFVYDGDNVVGDMLAGGTVQKQYVTATIDENLSMTGVAEGNTYYYSHDGLYSVRTLTDVGGVIKNSYDYTAFGVEYVHNSFVLVPQRYHFTGRELCSVASLQYNRRRMYDADIGRWISRDPILYAGGINLYTYVDNKSYRYSDAYGEKYTESIEFVDVKNLRLLYGMSASTGYTDITLKGADKIKESKDRRTANVTKSKSMSIESVTYLPTKKSTIKHPNKSMTSKGYKAVVAHEKRRRIVHKNGYNATLRLVTTLAKICNPLCCNTPGAAKILLQSWLFKLRQKAFTDFLAYNNKEQNGIDKENKKQVFSKRGHFTGFSWTHKIVDAVDMKAPACPKCPGK